MAMTDMTPRRRRFTIPGIGVPDPDEDFTANPVELFFDLAFVFAFAQLVARLIDDASIGGVSQTLLLFVLLWLPWTQYAWSANATSGNSRPVQVVFLLATAISIPMAASVPTAFGAGGFTFGASLAAIYGLGLILLLLGYDTGSTEWRSAVRYASPNAVSIVFLLAGTAVGTPVRTWLWIGALAVFVWSTLRAGGDDWIVRPGHFAERHGLIIIVALGEVIVAIAIPVLSGLTAGAGVGTGILGALTASGVFAGLLWWSYFDRPQKALEHAASLQVGPARGLFARDVYTFLHAPITAGIVLSAAALEEITKHPEDALPVEFRWMLFLGLALFLGGIDIAVFRAYRRIPPERSIAILAFGLLILVTADVPGLVVLVLVDVGIFVALIFEYLRLERRTPSPTA